MSQKNSLFSVKILITLLFFSNNVFAEKAKITIDGKSLGFSDAHLDFKEKEINTYEHFKFSIRYPSGVLPRVYLDSKGTDRFQVLNLQLGNVLVYENYFTKPGTYKISVLAFKRTSGIQKESDYGSREVTVVDYKVKVTKGIKEEKFEEDYFKKGRLPNSDDIEGYKNYDFSNLDSFVTSTPAEKEKDVRSLTQYLISKASNELEKTRVIFQWINTKIRYGMGLKEDPESVLINRKAQCGSYAYLFLAMAREAGLEVQFLAGAINRDSIPHAWNSVLIDGVWNLVDPTWGIFLPDPQEFASTHHTSKFNFRFQLIDKPYSRFDFLTKFASRSIENYAKPSIEDGYYLIKSEHTTGNYSSEAQCLTFDEENEKYLLDICNEDATEQKWQIQHTENGKYTIKNRKSDKYIIFAGTEKDDYGQLQVQDFECNLDKHNFGQTVEADNEKNNFYFVNLSNTETNYNIVNVYTKRALSPQYCYNENLKKYEIGGMPIHPWDFQFFSFHKTEIDNKKEKEQEENQEKENDYKNNKKIEIGSLILHKWSQNNFWRPGRILEFLENDRVGMKFIAGGETNVDLKDLIPFSWQVGSRLICKNNKSVDFLPATVKKIIKENLIVVFNESEEVNLSMGNCRMLDTDEINKEKKIIDQQKKTEKQKLKEGSQALYKAPNEDYWSPGYIFKLDGEKALFQFSRKGGVETDLSNLIAFNWDSGTNIICERDKTGEFVPGVIINVVADQILIKFSDNKELYLSLGSCREQDVNKSKNAMSKINNSDNLNICMPILENYHYNYHKFTENTKLLVSKNASVVKNLWKNQNLFLEKIRENKVFENTLLKRRYDILMGIQTQIKKNLESNNYNSLKTLFENYQSSVGLMTDYLGCRGSGKK